MNQCENEILEKNILERLIPNNIVPYIFGEGNDYAVRYYSLGAENGIIPSKMKGRKLIFPLYKWSKACYNM